jgi:Asparagine synthase
MLGSAANTVTAAPDHPLRPTPLELAAGQMFGEGPGPGALPPVPRTLTPLTALEEAVLPALERPPCLVSFSGGRDSSSVLAAATRAARRHGLELPVPITFRFPDAPMTDESEWQELVVAHLALGEWEIREIGDELDFVGPISGAVLRRHGVLHPSNAFLHLPLLEAARGGSLLTGLGGDHILMAWRGKALADLLAGRRRPAPRDVMRLGYAASPRAVRRVWERHREREGVLPWLRPRPRRAVLALTASERAEEPLLWGRSVGWSALRRELVAGRWSFGLLADDAGALILHPLLERRFLATVAQHGRRWGFGDRTAAMRALLEGALPDALLARPTKARFDEAFWRTHSRAFARAWDGGGVDPGLVDPEALRNEWLKPDPDARSTLLLQSAWLSQVGAVGPPDPDPGTRLPAGPARS